MALARALINEPLVVLADEPTGNLDSHATNEILAAVRRAARHPTDPGAGHATIARVAATAERLLTMRDGAIIDDTRLDGGLPRQTLLTQLAGWEA